MPISAQKQKQLEEVSNQISGPKNQEDLIRKFVHLFFERAHHLNVQRYTTSTLVRYVDFVWSHFQRREQDQSVLQIKAVENDQGINDEWVITLINNDRPYIIDTLRTVFDKWQININLLIHPVMHVQRDSNGVVKQFFSQRQLPGTNEQFVDESIILVHFNHTFTQTELVEFKAVLEQTLTRLFYTVDQQSRITSLLESIENNLMTSTQVSKLKNASRDALEFLQWLRDDHFLFLGVRYFEFPVAVSSKKQLCLTGESSHNCGLFSDIEILKAQDLWPRFCRTDEIETRDNSQEDDFPVVSVVKSNWRSPIIRPSRLDTIEIAHYSDSGEVIGLYQVIGLFSKDIFTTSSFDIPYLAAKATRVFNSFGVDRNWYDGKILISVIDSIPRDEMFYHSEAQLTDICERVINLLENDNLAVFTRPDEYGDYLTVIIYLPRERYSFELKNTMAEILANNYKGDVTSSVAQLGDLPFARIIYVLNFKDARPHDVSLSTLEAQLEQASLSWKDLLLSYAEKLIGESQAGRLLGNYRNGFPGAYKEKFDAEQAFEDIQQIELLTTAMPISLVVNQNKADLSTLTAKIYHLGEALPLSRVLPILANFGFDVISESSYAILRQQSKVHLHQFDLIVASSTPWENTKVYLQTAFQEIWHGNAENDGFNQLIIKAGLSVRQVCLLRAISKYLMQVKFAYSVGYLESTLSDYPDLAKLLVDYFEAKFDPQLRDKETLSKIEKSILDKLQSVNRLDHDKILRRILTTIKAMLRTNYFQSNHTGNKEYISFKFDCAKLEELPQPRPLYEIYVYSPRMEAIHLRGGKVARGGLRWSDRFEDYRTEVLGLMKAQMVKNSVIVPLGSKGGFIVKRQSQFTDRQELMQEVISCYQTMIRGMLDITDNLVNNKIVPPEQVVRYDGDDPYLVVAADKGTATFSDIANSISQEYNFWLDDAFASGGSAGYDHKKMAITSRGAWESVKRHFREQGISMDQPFTVVGVGDMSGDVFGNGMLRSDNICLVGAFDHRHIIIDPSPDPQKSFAERQRLFNLPRSSWEDYDVSILSKGGAIYSRNEKQITLSIEAQKLFDLSSPIVTPDELVQKLLLAPVDLLWFGGIGTFIKSMTESHMDVGDLANQAVRVNGKEVRAKVVAEGANLGVTQAGRIEYALKGGRINTDAIDNSAGVDCSDHEVNIKILFNSLTKSLTREDRDAILKDMTPEVASLVLQDNYRQTMILSVMQAQGVGGLSVFQNLIKTLENEANLNSTLESLPDDELIERRRAKGLGFTRPELAVLLAYAKNSLYSTLMGGSGIDITPYHDKLVQYFPTNLRQKFHDDIIKHPLHREIIMTCLTNDMINRVGPTFVYEIIQATNKTAAEIIPVYFKAVSILGLENLWDQIDGLDKLNKPLVQINSYLTIITMLKSVVIKLLNKDEGDLDPSIVSMFVSQLEEMIVGEQAQVIQSQIKNYKEMSVSRELSHQLALIPYMGTVIDVTLTVREPAHMKTVAKAYYILRSRLGFDWLAQYLQQINSENDWQRVAQLGLIEDSSQLLTRMTEYVVYHQACADVEKWLQENRHYQRQALENIGQIKASIRPDFGLMSFVIKQLQRILNFK